MGLATIVFFNMHTLAATKINLVENWINKKTVGNTTKTRKPSSNFPAFNKIWVSQIKSSYSSRQSHLLGPDGEYFIAPERDALKQIAEFISLEIFSDAGLQRDRYLLQ